MRHGVIAVCVSWWGYRTRGPGEKLLAPTTRTLRSSRGAMITTASMSTANQSPNHLALNSKFGMIATYSSQASLR